MFDPRPQRQLGGFKLALMVLGAGGAITSAYAAGVPAGGDGSAASNPDLYGGNCNCLSATAPAEKGADPFELAWSVALRGAYSGSSLSGAHYELQLLPEFSVTRAATGAVTSLTGSAEFDLGSDGSSRVGALRLGYAGDVSFDQVSAGSLHWSLEMTQASPSSAGLPANTASAPLKFSGMADGEVRRSLGRFEVNLRGNLARSVSGPTVLGDASVIDNSADNNWELGAGARLGYQLTPILTAFIDGSASYQKYDVTSPSLLVFLDGWDYAGKTGLSVKWNDVLNAEASVGFGYRDYADASLVDAGSWLYDASVTFKPDATLSLTGKLSTSIGPAASSPYASEIAFAANAELAYEVNPLLGLRGSAGWTYARDVASAADTTAYDFGAGFDYRLGSHVAVTGDYGFAQSVTSADPVGETSHSVALGLRLSR